MTANGSIDVEPLPTHRFTLSEIEDAIGAFRIREAGAFRVMPYPGRDREGIERTAA